MKTAVSAKGKNILLVEDDPAVRASIKLLLSIDRHTVTEAANGHEALQLFTGSRYDLVILDYRMPEMLGDELMHQYLVTYTLPDGVKPSEKLSVSVKRKGVTLRAPTRIPDK